MSGIACSVAVLTLANYGCFIQQSTMFIVRRLEYIFYDHLIFPLLLSPFYDSF
jgi:hypothetical protein